jgi:CIC family chloride channel protein
VELAGGAAALLPAWLPPVAGGLVVGLLARALIGPERHQGVAGVMEAVALAGGRLRYWRMPQKAVAAAVSIGSGASVGPEDPSVQIGSNLGSMLGQWMRLSDDRMRALVAAGAAGGIAAAFNAPIAGVFFALEVILGELAGGALGVVVLASVVASAFTRAVVGLRPEFEVPEYALRSAWELPLYLALGLLAGAVSAAYIRGFAFFHEAFRRLRAPRWLKPAIGGVAVGGMAYVLPEVRGVGYGAVEEILQGQLPVPGLLLALLLGKLLLTPLCIASGFQGGVFAPALFLGAALGGVFGSVAGEVVPSLAPEAPAYAMAGMAAVLAGAARCPLTATLLLFELTDDYRVVLPVLLAVVASHWVSQKLEQDSVYTASLTRKGIRLERGRDIDLLEGIAVGDVMRREAPTVRETDTLAEATEALARLHMNGIPVVDARGELCGVVTVGDIDRAHAAGVEDVAAVGSVCTREVLVAHPDETIGAALRRMGARDIGRLPVVARDAPRRIVGLLRRVEIVRAYDVAVARRATARHRVEQARLGILGGVEVEEVTLEEGAPGAGLAMRDVPWPKECVVATIRRRHELLIPRGDTRLLPGDVLLMVADGRARAEVQRLCRAPRDAP